jgi:quinol-cytochrome oxidoreductase complex cytochrome b subunit
VVGWVDQRTGASGFLTGMLYRKVPKGTNWFYTLGSATLFAFVIQALTGVFLAMFYTPSPTQAYGSITHINNDVPLGEFVHGLHKWGASVMIILIFLHMARTFVFGAYKYPRELNWVIGVVLLILTFVMGLTGYLLPFDQRSFWATEVANNITATGPLVGPYLADFLRAGNEIGATTLPRFYAVHMLLVPGLIIALIGAHLYLVVKQGTTAPPWLSAETKPKSLRQKKV